MAWGGAGGPGVHHWLKLDLKITVFLSFCVFLSTQVRPWWRFQGSQLVECVFGASGRRFQPGPVASLGSTGGETFEIYRTLYICIFLIFSPPCQLGLW